MMETAHHSKRPRLEDDHRILQEKTATVDDNFGNLENEEKGMELPAGPGLSQDADDDMSTGTSVSEGDEWEEIELPPPKELHKEYPAEGVKYQPVHTEEMGETEQSTADVGLDVVETCGVALNDEIGNDGEKAELTCEADQRATTRDEKLEVSSPTEPVKRKRGRPRKVLTKEEEEVKKAAKKKADEENNGKKKSGIKGVFWHASSNAWIAQWVSEGKTHRSYFTVTSHGEEEAKRRAVECRKKMEEGGKVSGVRGRRRKVEPPFASEVEGVLFLRHSNNWQAQWVDNGVKKTASFSARRYGFQEAKEKAERKKREIDGTLKSE